MKGLMGIVETSGWFILLGAFNGFCAALNAAI